MVNLKTPPTEVAAPQNKLSLVYRDSDQTLPQKLLQPQNIAIVASAVLHGVIGYGAPALPFFQRPAIPREVQIMQLTPQEQSRIRRDAPPRPPAVTGVPIPNAPGQGRTIPPGFSGNNNFNSSSRFGGFPTSDPDDSPTFVQRNPSQFRGTFGSSVPQFTIPANPGSTAGNTPVQPVTPRETPAPNSPVRQSERFTTAQSFTTGGRSISPFPTPSPSAATPTPSPTPTTNDPTSAGGNPNNLTTTNPTPVPTTSPNATPNTTTGGGGGGNPNNGGNNNGNPGSITPNPLLAFNPERTELSTDGQNTEFLGFLGAGDEQLLQPDKQVRLTLDVKYPLAACVLKLEKPVTAILGVITNQEGAISKGPDILQSSGYEIFNQAAKDAVLKYNQFTPAKAYLFTVPFAYSPEVCAEAGNIAPVASP